MAGRRRIRVQVLRKKYSRQCALCREDRYAMLDCHRVVPGEEGGRYEWSNTVALCVRHHREVTTGLIRIVARRRGTRGTYLHWFDVEGVEHFTLE